MKKSKLPAEKGGCAADQQGRQGIYEVLRVTPEVEEAILKQAQAPEILEAARVDVYDHARSRTRLYSRWRVCLEEFTRVLVVN